MPADLHASLSRIVSQGLVSATCAHTPVEAVESLLALQGQLVSAIPWAIGVRCPGVSRAQVEESFARGELVRSWPMRGTVHVTSARDHHWLRRVLRHRRASWERRAIELGLVDAVVERAAAASYVVLETAPQGVSRAELIEAWQGAGIEVISSASSEAGLRRRHLMMRLHLDGFLTSGPVRAGEHLLIDARSLPQAPGVAKWEAGHEEALALLAARYAWGHGPIDAADLARWTGLTLTEARRALGGALEVTETAGMRLSRRGDAVARADLEDLVASGRDEARGTFALPAFDELHVGYRDRTCLTDEAGERLICPAKNGMFRPIVVSGGRVVAVRAPGGILSFADGGEAHAQEARALMKDWENWMSK